MRELSIRYNSRIVIALKVGYLPRLSMPYPLKLCYVADATNIHVQRWLRYFIDRGHDVTCMTDKVDEAKFKLLEGARIITIPNRDTQQAKGKPTSKTAVLKARTKAIKQHLKQERADVLHAIFLYQRGWSAAYTRFHPLVITLLGSDIYLPRKNYRGKLQFKRDQALNALSLSQADLITGVSDDLCKTAMQLTHGQNTVELVPIGVDPSLFMPDLDTSDLREKLSIPDDRFVILSPRQMMPLYNQETIIQSIPKVLNEIPNAIFILKDTFCNTDERRAYVRRLHDLATALNVNHAIRWAEEVEMWELPYFYNLADVVVSIPSTDGMPVTLFEAMACNKPVIVGDLPSYNEVIINGQTGIRVPIRNHQALGQAIIKLHKNHDLVERIIEESQVILQQYGLFDQQMQRMERYYYALKSRRMFNPNRMLNAWNNLSLDTLVNLT